MLSPTDCKNLLQSMGEDAFVDHLLRRHRIREMAPKERAVQPMSSKSYKRMGMDSEAERTLLRECYGQAISAMPVVLVHPRYGAPVVQPSPKAIPLSAEQCDSMTRQITNPWLAQPTAQQSVNTLVENTEWKTNRIPRLVLISR